MAWSNFNNQYFIMDKSVFMRFIFLFSFLLFISTYTTPSVKFRFPMSKNGNKRPFLFAFIVLYFITTYAVLFNCGGSFLHMIGKGTTNQKYDKYCVFLREIPLQIACRSRFAAVYRCRCILRFIQGGRLNAIFILYS